MKAKVIKDFDLMNGWNDFVFFYKNEIHKIDDYGCDFNQIRILKDSSYIKIPKHYLTSNFIVVEE